MTLGELKAGDFAVIKEIGTKPETKRRLMDIGLTRGAEVEVLRFAPFGDPVEISVKDFCLALRMSDAKNITVLKLSRPKTDSALLEIVKTSEEDPETAGGNDKVQNKSENRAETGQVPKTSRNSSLFRSLRGGRRK